MRKKEKIFIAVSLIAFFAVFFAASSLKATLTNTKETASPGTIYNLKDNFEEADPLMTKVPQFDDMLAGPIISADDPQLGNPEAKINLVLFADYECSYGQEQIKTLKNVAAKHPEARLIWKDYPNTDTVSLSYQAAVAGRCAAEQNKFWEYNELLFANNQRLEKELFINLADQLNLDQEAFENCLKSENANLKIKDNIDEANALQITGVPFLFINSQEIMGKADADEIERIIKLEEK